MNNRPWLNCCSRARAIDARGCYLWRSSLLEHQDVLALLLEHRAKCKTFEFAGWPEDLIEGISIKMGLEA